MFLSLKWSFLRQYWVNCLVFSRFPMLYTFFYGRKSFLLWQTFLMATDIFCGDRHVWWWQTCLTMTDIFDSDRHFWWWQTFLAMTNIFDSDRHFWWWQTFLVVFKLLLRVLFKQNVTYCGWMNNLSSCIRSSSAKTKHMFSRPIHLFGILCMICYCGIVSMKW